MEGIFLINVLIVDDMPIYIKRHERALAKRHDVYNVAGTACSGGEAYELAKKLKPDLILMDIQMETDDAGIVAARKIKEELPDVKIIAVTIHEDDEIILSAFDAGICEYIIKTDTDENILDTIDNAISMEGQCNKINNLIVKELVNMRKERESILFCANLISRLSRTEIEVLKMLCNGMTYQEIADVRYVEHGTIRVIVNKISKKFAGANIRDVINDMHKNGIIKLLDNF